MSQIEYPLMYVNDPTKSRAIFNGSLFFGLVDTDPTIASNQKLVKAVQENGSLVSLAQPVATNSGGNPTFNGSPVVLDVDGDYSFQANDRFNAKVVFVSRVENPEDGSDGFSGIVAIEQNTLSAGQTTVTLTNLGANESVFYLQTSVGDQGFLAKDIDYTVTNSTTIELTLSYNLGDKIIARQNDPTGQLIPVSSAKTLLVYDTLALAQAAAVSGELNVGDTVTLNGRDSAFDGLGVDKGKVQLTTESNDNVNFFDLNTTLQLSTQSNYYRFLNYSETKSTAGVSAGILTIDIDNGTTQEVVLDENISSVVFVNQNPDTGFVSTVSVKITQDVVGSRSISWPAIIIWPGGVAPTLTTAPDAIDFFGFTTYDAGVTWLGATYGQDYS